MTALETEMHVDADMVQESINLNARMAQDQTEYQRRYSEMVPRYETAKAHLDEVKAAITDKCARRDAAEMFLNTLRKQEQLLMIFNEDLCILWWSA